MRWRLFSSVIQMQNTDRQEEQSLNFLSGSALRDCSIQVIKRHRKKARLLVLQSFWKNRDSSQRGNKNTRQKPSTAPLEKKKKKKKKQWFY